MHKLIEKIKKKKIQQKKLQNWVKKKKKNYDRKEIPIVKNYYNYTEFSSQS